MKSLYSLSCSQSNDRKSQITGSKRRGSERLTRMKDINHHDNVATFKTWCLQHSDLHVTTIPSYLVAVTPPPLPSLVMYHQQLHCPVISPDLLSMNRCSRVTYLPQHFVYFNSTILVNLKEGIT
jgi:hypothetical protein